MVSFVYMLLLGTPSLVGGLGTSTPMEFDGFTSWALRSCANLFGALYNKLAGPGVYSTAKQQTKANSASPRFAAFCVVWDSCTAKQHAQSKKNRWNGCFDCHGKLGLACISACGQFTTA